MPRYRSPSRPSSRVPAGWRDWPERFRSQGQGEAANIRGQKEKELEEITSQAFRTSEELRGEADAQATKIYATAYQQDPEFFQFLRTMESYPDTLDKDSTVLFSTDSEYFRYLQGAGKAR